jgi:hypothetical protein
VVNLIRPVVRRRLLAATVLVAVSLPLWAGYKVWRALRRTAESSCLASVQASLSRQDVFGAVAAGAEWREWTADETVAVLVRAEPGDCASDWWRRDVGIRTRRRTDGKIDSQMWRRTDPRVLTGPW